MDFYIRKGSTMPFLTMEVIQNGNGDTEQFYNLLKNAEILFYMEEYKSCMPIIQCGACCIIEQSCNNCPSVLVQYKWLDGETDNIGRYKGWFEIYDKDSTNKMISPVKDNLIIHII